MSGYVAAVHTLWCSGNRATVSPAHSQEVLSASTLQRGTCCMMHPIVCGLPFGRQTTCSSMGIVDVAAPRWACSAQDTSLLMPTFLEVKTCRIWVRPFACTFQEEEPWSAYGCLGEEYVTAPLKPVSPIEHPLDVVEADRRSRVRRIRSRPWQIHASVETIS
jgi:hypothetical protein